MKNKNKKARANAIDITASLGNSQNPYLNLDRFYVDKNLHPHPSTNSIFQPHINPLGPGNFDVTIHPDSDMPLLTDLTKNIPLQMATALEYSEQSGNITIIEDHFYTNVDQGCFFTRLRPRGFDICNTGRFAISGDQTQLFPVREQWFTASSVEGFDGSLLNPNRENAPSSHPSYMTDWSDLGCTIQMQTMNQPNPAAPSNIMKVIQVHGDPFITMEVQGDVTWQLSTSFEGNAVLPPPPGIASFGEGYFLPPVPVPGVPNAWYLTYMLRAQPSTTQFDQQLGFILFSNAPLTFDSDLLGPSFFMVVPDEVPIMDNPGHFLPDGGSSYQYLYDKDSAQANLKANGPITVGMEYQSQPPVKYEYDASQPDHVKFTNMQGQAARAKSAIRLTETADILAKKVGQSALVLRLIRIPEVWELSSTTSPMPTPTDWQTTFTAIAAKYADIVAVAGNMPLPTAAKPTTYSYAYSCRSLSNWSKSAAPGLPLMTILPTDELDPSSNFTPADSLDFLFSLKGQQRLIQPSSPTQSYTFKLSTMDSSFGIDTPLTVNTNGVSQAQLDFLEQALAGDLAQLTAGPIRFDATYEGGKQLSRFALTLLYLVKKNPGHANIAPAITKLQLAFTTWLTTRFTYDKTSGAVLAKAGYFNQDANFNAVWLQDLFYHYGYFLIAASALSESQKMLGQADWFANTPIYAGSPVHMADIVNLLIDTCVSPTDNDLFPKMRLFLAPYGFFNAHGLLGAQEAGINMESTAEAANFAFGVQLWGKLQNIPEREGLGALLYGRLIKAAQGFWQIGSTNSIYNNITEFSSTIAPWVIPVQDLSLITTGNATSEGWPNMSVLWSGLSARSNFSNANPITQIGIETITFVPSIINSLFDPAWATRIVEKFMQATISDPKQQANPDDPATWKLLSWPFEVAPPPVPPPVIAYFIPIVLPLITYYNPARAYSVYTTYLTHYPAGTTLVDETCTASMVLFLILYQQISKGSGTISWSPTTLPATTPAPLSAPGEIIAIDQQRIQDYLNGSPTIPPAPPIPNAAGRLYPYDALKKAMQLLRTPSVNEPQILADQQQLLAMYDDLLTRLASESFTSWDQLSSSYSKDVLALNGKFPPGPLFQALVDFTIATLLPAPLPQSTNPPLPPTPPAPEPPCPCPPGGCKQAFIQLLTCCLKVPFCRLYQRIKKLF